MREKVISANNLLGGKTAGYKKWSMAYNSLNNIHHWSTVKHCNIFSQKRTQLYFTTNVVAEKTYIIKHKLNKLNKRIFVILSWK